MIETGQRLPPNDQPQAAGLQLALESPAAPVRTTLFQLALKIITAIDSRTIFKTDRDFASAAELAYRTNQLICSPNEGTQLLKSCLLQAWNYKVQRPAELQLLFEGKIFEGLPMRGVLRASDDLDALTLKYPFEISLARERFQENITALARSVEQHQTGPQVVDQLLMLAELVADSETKRERPAAAAPAPNIFVECARRIALVTEIAAAAAPENLSAEASELIPPVSAHYATARLLTVAGGISEKRGVNSLQVRAAESKIKLSDSLLADLSRTFAGSDCCRVPQAHSLKETFLSRAAEWRDLLGAEVVSKLAESYEQTAVAAALNTIRQNEALIKARMQAAVSERLFLLRGLEGNHAPVAQQVLTRDDYFALSKAAKQFQAEYPAPGTLHLKLHHFQPIRLIESLLVTNAATVEINSVLPFGAEQDAAAPQWDLVRTAHKLSRRERGNDLRLLTSEAVNSAKVLLFWELEALGVPGDAVRVLQLSGTPSTYRLDFEWSPVRGAAVQKTRTIIFKEVPVLDLYSLPAEKQAQQKLGQPQTTALPDSVLFIDTDQVEQGARLRTLRVENLLSLELRRTPRVCMPAAAAPLPARAVALKPQTGSGEPVAAPSGMEPSRPPAKKSVEEQRPRAVPPPPEGRRGPPAPKRPCPRFGPSL